MLEIILQRLPATLLLMITQYVVAIVAGIILGVISARRQGTVTDAGVTLLSVVGFAVPVFWLGQMLMLVFSIKLGLFPAQGMMSLRYDLGPLDQALDIAHHLVLPATTLAIFNLGADRAADAGQHAAGAAARIHYIRAIQRHERANGRLQSRAAQRGAARRHGHRPQLKNVITGAVLTETVFAWPGLGRLTFDAINARDYPVLMAMFVLRRHSRRDREPAHRHRLRMARSEDHARMTRDERAQAVAPTPGGVRSPRFATHPRHLAALRPKSPRDHRAWFWWPRPS